MTEHLIRVSIPIESLVENLNIKYSTPRAVVEDATYNKATKEVILTVNMGPLPPKKSED